jgi:prevent-host-death family protein
LKTKEDIRPVTYLKGRAADLLAQINTTHRPVIITQNGEARAVLMDVHSYEESQETLALLQILAIGKKQVASGQVHPLADVIRDIRARHATKVETARGNGTKSRGQGR